MVNTIRVSVVGIALMLQQGLNLAYGPEVRTAQSGLGTNSLFGGMVTISDIKVISFVLCILLAASVILFMKKSRMGQAIRATAQDARAAKIMGIDTERVYAFTYALNAAICGAAGVLVARYGPEVGVADADVLVAIDSAPPPPVG